MGTSIRRSRGLPAGGSDGQIIKKVSGVASWADESTSGGVVKATYADLMTLKDAAGLTPGGLYGITDFATRHYFVDGAGSQCYDLEDAPAPGNISLVADTVGANPVKYYYKCCYYALIDNVPCRSLFSIEFTCTQGDSTTALTFNCGAIPEWSSGILLERGVVSGVHTHSTEELLSEIPVDIFSIVWAEDDVDSLPIHQVPGSTPSTNTGTTETIIVRALDVNILSTHALSVDYPQDVLEYDWNPINWIGDPSFGADGTIIDGWKGVITWRHDKILDNYMQYDYRNVLFRRWTGGYVEYDTATVYSVNDRVLHSDGIIYGAIADITPEEVWTEEHWYKVWNTANGEYWMHTPTGNAGETFDDLPTFGGVALENKFEKFVDVSDGDYLLLNNTFLEDSYFNVFGNSCNNNVFGNSCNNNVFRMGCSYNVFGMGCNYNVFGLGCRYNVFGNGCYSNIFGNSCYSNVFWNGCNSNVFGNGCDSNVFGNSCYSNVFGNGCEYIQLPPSSTRNDFKSGVAGTEGTPLNLTASTLVIGDYPVTYTVNADDTIVASYVDTNGKTQIVDALTEIALYKVYKALISQSNVELTSGTLEVGKSYYIRSYLGDDDFTNVGAASNETGVTFEATGTTPTTWTNSSVLVDVAESAPTETVIEDTTGVESIWSYVIEGKYRLTKTGIFTEGKTLIHNQRWSVDVEGLLSIFYTRQDIDTISLRTYLVSGGSYMDGILNNDLLYFEIYP